MKQNEIIQNDRKTTLCIYTGKLKVKKSHASFAIHIR